MSFNLKDFLKNNPIKDIKAPISVDINERFQATLEKCETWSSYRLIIDDTSGTKPFQVASARLSLWAGEELELDEVEVTSGYHTNFHSSSGSARGLDELKFVQEDLNTQRQITDYCVGFMEHCLKQKDALVELYVKNHVKPTLAHWKKQAEEREAKEREVATLMESYDKISSDEADAILEAAVRECHEHGESSPRKFIAFTKTEMFESTLRLKIIESEGEIKSTWQELKKDEWRNMSTKYAEKIITRSRVPKSK